MKFYSKMTQPVTSRVTIDVTLKHVRLDRTLSGVRILRFDESSRRAPVTQVDVAIAGMTIADYQMFEPLAKPFSNNEGARPEILELTISETMSGVTYTRTLSLFAAKAEWSWPTGELTLSLVSIDGVMTLQEVLWEGQISLEPRFYPAEPVDTTWNRNFNTLLSRAADWQFITAATGLTWQEYDAPPANTSLTVKHADPITYWEIASSLAQLWGRYVVQGPTPYSWTTRKFARTDLTARNLTYLTTILEERYSTNTDWADVIDFTWEQSTLDAATGERETSTRSKRVGSRSSVISRAKRLDIQRSAASNKNLLESAREGIRLNQTDVSVVMLLDVTIELGQKLITKVGELYVSSISHNLDAGTSTLELRGEFPVVDTSETQVFTIQADGYDWDVSSWTPQPVPPFVTLTYSNLRFDAPATNVTCTKSVRSGASTLSPGTNLSARDLFLPAGASGSYVFTVTT